MTRGLVVGFCVLALAASSAGFVQPVVAQTDESSDTDARSWFDKGRVAYEAGNFDEAARAFRRAYVLSPRFALLYNIGQAELRAGRDQLAIEAFEGYLRQAPADDPRRSEVQERARVLHSMGVRGTDPAAAETTTAPSSEPAATDTAPTPATEPVAPDAVATSATADESATSGSTNIVPWMVVAGGGAVVVGGVVMMVVGASKSSNVTDAPDGTRWVDIKGDADSANVFWGIGLGMVTVGLAASGVGLVWALGGDSNEDPSAAHANVHLGVGNVLLEGAF